MGVLTDKYFICSRICSALAGSTWKAALPAQWLEVLNKKCQYHTRQERTLPHKRLERSSWTLEESKYHSCLQHGQSGRSRTYGLVILISVPGKEIEQPILETLSKLMKDRKMSGSSQNGFTKGKSCLTNVTAFQNMATSSVDVAYLAFIRLLTPVALQRKALGNLWTLSWLWARNALL